MSLLVVIVCPGGARDDILQVVWCSIVSLLLAHETYSYARAAGLLAHSLTASREELCTLPWFDIRTLAFGKKSLLASLFRHLKVVFSWS